ncbi:MAG TPA: gephyrin-like molybdotransferase Glp [Chitinophagaceae bacterium]|nr:gephyrin-like molybdotransferase Glp [Chitinophagaceae bacterium]
MAAEMLNVTEAKKIILEHAVKLPSVKLPLSQAAGMVLAEDVYAAINIPAYAQSSMDGYAFSFADLDPDKPLKIKGVIAAGSNDTTALSPGNAVRIFTGAPVPNGADTVVMQEKTKIENDSLYIKDENMLQGLNVRPKGSEIKAGDLAVAKDSLLMPAAIGFLAGIGVIEVLVYPLPVVSIIVTGNELQTPGQPLLLGQVYESNSFSLQAALKQMHITDVKVYRAEDTLESVKQVLKEALQKSNIIFLTGGVSVGDYDFVAAAAEQNGIEKVFHKIKQKPGKPFYFGIKENKLVFGLPGNPASVLTCFYEYVEPALRKISKQKTGLQVMKVPLATSFKKAAGLTHFLKGHYDGEIVIPLSAQESYRLSSFANANCLIKINEETTICEKDDLVEIHLLPL